MFEKVRESASVCPSRSNRRLCGRTTCRGNREEETSDKVEQQTRLVRVAHNMAWPVGNGPGRTVVQTAVFCLISHRRRIRRVVEPVEWCGIDAGGRGLWGRGGPSQVVTTVHQWKRDVCTARSPDRVLSSAPASVRTGAADDGRRQQFRGGRVQQGAVKINE